VQEKLYYLIALSLHSGRLRQGGFGTTKAGTCCTTKADTYRQVLMSFSVRTVSARKSERIARSTRGNTREIARPSQSSFFRLQNQPPSTLQLSLLDVAEGVHSTVTKHLHRDYGHLQ
jgi:hypothetical protein